MSPLKPHIGLIGRHQLFLRTRYLGLVLSLLFSLPAPVAAMHIINVDVHHEEEIYTIEMDIHLSAPPAAVYRVLSDYRQLHRLSHNITQSELLFSYNPDHHRIKTTTSACILFFCRSLVQVQNINEIEGREIMAVSLPEKSNVRFATVHWKLNPAQGQTRLQVSAQLVPEFWMPPLIGPWFIKRGLHSGMAEMVANIEHYAAAHSAER